VIVRSVDDGYELVAGYHRVAACRKLGHAASFTGVLASSA